MTLNFFPSLPGKDPLGISIDKGALHSILRFPAQQSLLPVYPVTVHSGQ